MTESLSPGMVQFYEIKQQYEDCILFFRMGDFYEMFGDDANIAHEVLGIAVTSRNKNAKDPIPLAGIPFHAKEKYLPQLVKAGYKVAIAEQISDPKLKGLVKREVVRVVTPATLQLEGENYEGNNQIENIILSISSSKEKFGISVLNLVSNKWYTGEFDSLADLQSQLYKISPKEVILDKKVFNNQELTNTLQKKYSLNIFYYHAKQPPKKLLLMHFGVKNLLGYGIDTKSLSICASALLLEYIQDTQKSSFDFLQDLYYENFSTCMDLDESTIKNLDLIYNISTQSTTIGTLFGVLNKTKTSAGARFLKEQILHPLQDIDEITARQDVVEEFVNNPILLSKVQNELESVSDIDLILNRLALDRSSIRDLVSLKKSLQAIVNIFEIIKATKNKKLIQLLKL